MELIPCKEKLSLAELHIVCVPDSPTAQGMKILCMRWEATEHSLALCHHPAWDLHSVSPPNDQIQRAYPHFPPLKGPVWRTTASSENADSSVILRATISTVDKQCGFRMFIPLLLWVNVIPKQPMEKWKIYFHATGSTAFWNYFIWSKTVSHWMSQHSQGAFK